MHIIVTICIIIKQYNIYTRRIDCLTTVVRYWMCLCSTWTKKIKWCSLVWSRSIQSNVRLSPEKHDKKNTQNLNPVHRSLNLYGWGPRREAAMLCLMFISVLIVVRKLAHVIIRSDTSTQRSNKIINHEKKYPLQIFWKTLLLQTSRCLTFEMYIFFIKTLSNLYSLIFSHI